MPLGSKHEETGILICEGPELLLARDGGDRWRLDGVRPHEALLDGRVRVVGTRSGFDLLDVQQVQRPE